MSLNGDSRRFGRGGAVLCGTARSLSPDYKPFVT